jgi:hypothetical protein
MNERMKELMTEAGMLYTLDSNPTHIDVNGTHTFQEVNIYKNFDLEKFAELIVKECLKKVEEEYKPVLEDKEMMKDTHWDGYVQCGVDSYVAIREHFFGVEE